MIEIRLRAAGSSSWSPRWNTVLKGNEIVIDYGKVQSKVSSTPAVTSTTAAGPRASEIF